MGPLRWLGGKESTCKYRRHRRHVRSLGQEDPLEEEMAPHLYSFLDHLIDRGALWATVHGVAKRQTQLSDRACTHTHTHTVSSSRHSVNV